MLILLIKAHLTTHYNTVKTYNYSGSLINRAEYQRVQAKNLTAPKWRRWHKVIIFI